MLDLRLRAVQDVFIQCLAYLLRSGCHLYLLASGADQTRLSESRNTTTTRAATRQSTGATTTAAAKSTTRGVDAQDESRSRQRGTMFLDFFFPRKVEK